MPNYLDDLSTYSARATLVIADLGIEAAEILAGQGDAMTEIDKINRYTTWLTGANDTAQLDDLRLRLLTLLVDNARLDEVPTPNVFQVTLVFGNTTVTATQWGLIIGNINDQLDLIDKFDTYLPLAGGTMSGNIIFGTDGLGIDVLNEGDTLNIGASSGIVQFGLDGVAKFNIIDEGFFEGDEGHLAISGRAMQLEQKLRKTEVGFEAEKMLRYANQFGSLLGKLHKLHPERISKDVKDGYATWTINPPSR